jgi:hypothetical protein
MKPQRHPHPPPPPLTPAGRAWLGARIGAAVGVLGLGVGVIRFAITFRFGIPLTDAESGELLKTALLVGGYWAAFVIAGATFGLLAPLRHSGFGAFFLGYLAAGIVCGAIGVMLFELDHHHDRSSAVWASVFTTAVFGSLLGYKLFKDRHSDS